jgi:hypothetical protein
VTGLQILGVGMLAAFFVGVFVAIAVIDGPAVAAGVFALAGVSFGFIVCAIVLATGELS